MKWNAYRFINLLETYSDPEKNPSVIKHMKFRNCIFSMSESYEVDGCWLVKEAEKRGGRERRYCYWEARTNKLTKSKAAPKRRFSQFVTLSYQTSICRRGKLKANQKWFYTYLYDIPSNNNHIKNNLQIHIYPSTFYFQLACYEETHYRARSLGITHHSLRKQIQES